MSAYKDFKATKFGRMFVRTVIRSFWLIGMTVSAGLCLEMLVQAARFGGSDIVARFPELLVIFRAVTIMTWFEVSLLWIRLAVSPKIDFQELANKLTDLTGDAVNSPTGSRSGVMVVYLTNNLFYLLRFVALMKLCEFI